MPLWIGESRPARNSAAIDEGGLGTQLARRRLRFAAVKAGDIFEYELNVRAW
jgi:hypothetical protein